VEAGSHYWTPYLIGRPEPRPFSVIRYPTRYDRVAYVRRESNGWARVPGPLDTTNHDYAADAKLTLAQIVDVHGWDWDLAGAGLATSSDSGAS
jgi:hypothetical protein